jgi:hypothetical protein
MTRASVDQVVQLGVEYTSGTRMAATRRLPGLNFSLTPQAETQRFRGKGYNIDTTSVIHKLWQTGTYDGILDYNQIVYPLSGLIGLVGTGPVVIGATAGYTWDFNPVSTGADPYPKTFSLEEGDAEAAQVSTFLKFNSLNIDWTNDSLTFSGNAYSRIPTDSLTLTALTDEEQTITKSGTVTGGTFTITYSAQTTSAIAYDATAATIQTALEALSNLAPGDVEVYGGPISTTAVTIVFKGTLAGTNVAAITVDSTSLTGGGSYAVATSVAGGAAITSIAQRPVSRMQVDIYVDTSAGALGTTKVTEAYAGSLSIGDKTNPFWALNTDYDSFKDIVRIPAEVNFSFSTAHNSQSRALFSSLSTNPTKYVRFKAVGENIGASADEQITIDMVGNFMSPEKQEDVNGVYGYKFNFASIHDTTLGEAYNIHVVNRLTTI